MPRYGQFIMGPAGVGKSTYCKYIQEHAEVVKRTVHIVNLDPAAEVFNYKVDVDIKDLISVEDVMEELNLGPNGGLMYCMEYLANNLSSWLEEELDSFSSDAYFLFDCPGQIELFSHVPIMKTILQHIVQHCDVKLCGVYLIDSLFIDDASKFLSGTMCALSSMASLELPHINVITKCDLIDTKEKEETLEKYLYPQKNLILSMLNKSTSTRYQHLNHAIATLIEEYSMVSFVSLNINDDDTVAKVFYHCDHCIQYGEDLEPQEPKTYDDDGDD